MTEDRILVQDMVFYGYHGVNPEEKTLGQRFIVDLEISRDLQRAGQTDDLNQTLSYARAFKLTREILEGPSRDLIETVAESIAQRILAEDGVEAVRVRVRKPWAPVKGAHLGFAGVEVLRRKGA